MGWTRHLAFGTEMRLSAQLLIINYSLLTVTNAALPFGATFTTPTAAWRS
jgi:hypothetical protein